MTAWFSRFRRYCRGVLLIVEASVLLVVSRAAVALLPDRAIRWYVARQNPEAVFMGGDVALHRTAEVRRAIHRASAHLPGTYSCMPRALTALRMCRFRRLGAAFYFGAARVDREIRTHVWVMCGAEGVTGHRVADEYKVLERFPPV